jgi:hypothetical protein
VNAVISAVRLRLSKIEQCVHGAMLIRYCLVSVVFQANCLSDAVEWRCAKSALEAVEMRREVFGQQH